MAEIKHYVGEVGTAVIVDCGQDISAATGVSLSVKKPDGTTASWSATIYTLDGDPNYLRHVTIASDFSMAGVYEIQAVLTLGSWTGRGQTTNFIVYENFS